MVRLILIILLGVSFFLGINPLYAQTGFKKDAEVELILSDGRIVTGIVKGFSESLEIKTELGFKTKFKIGELWKINYTGEKDGDYLIYEYFFVDGRVVKGRPDWGITFRIDFGDRIEQEVNLGYFGDPRVKTISLKGYGKKAEPPLEKAIEETSTPELPSKPYPPVAKTEPPKPPASKTTLKPLQKGVKCIDSEGEAAIINNDIPSAKAEALARAKWNAVEQVGGVVVKAQSVVQNMALVDDMVSKQIKGLVTGYNIKKSWQEGDVYKVIANVCVETSLADDALSLLSLNNSVAVFIPAKKPRLVSETEERHTGPSGKRETYSFRIEDEYEETNILSETIIGRLTEQGVRVIDIAPTHLTEAQLIEQAIKAGNFTSLRSLMYQSLSNILLIGKVDYTISTKKGQDIGYGISMPFNNVTTRLTYRLVAREEGSGRIIVLSAGTEEGKGMAPNIEDAAARSMKDLADRFTPVVFDKLSRYIQGITKKVRIKVLDIKDTSRLFEIKELIQNTAWVTSVEEKGLGELMVGYPENIVYLANSLSQKGFEVVDFSTSSLTLRYKPF